MEPQTIARGAADLAEEAKELAEQALTLAQQAQQIALTSADQVAGHDFISLLTVFALACFVGYYVVWSVTPALHSPLMGVTNAISSVIVVGALIATGTGEFGFSQVMGFLAVTLASVNIFGGFIVTHRMLSMFKKKAR
ncbi:MAG: NAD(P) transhydrogenase subunit alpha [Alphaproteobacteria bacterium]|nr:NAD(P) transhydrogenase subunit alpha [Alphaproteobacteria bacterium]